MLTALSLVGVSPVAEYPLGPVHTYVNGSLPPWLTPVVKKSVLPVHTGFGKATVLRTGLVYTDELTELVPVQPLLSVTVR